MKRYHYYISAGALALLLGGVAGMAPGISPVPLAYAADEHDDHDEHGHEEEKQNHAEGEGHGAHGEEEGAEISQAAAANAAIAVAEAGAATVHETVILTGRVTLNQNKTAQVKARFHGLVREVQKNLGDTVAAGDVLASVESNDSLQVYTVKAPISGIVLARDTNIGDVAGDDPLFVIADMSEVWAEFYVFPRDIEHVTPGQKVHIKTADNGMETQATIASLLPTAEASSQTVVARAVIDNKEGHWRSGMTVQGRVIVAERNVPVAVQSSAVQRLEGSSVIFVQEGEKYEARKVELGTGDDEWMEIRSGLKAGERYVTKNSFVVKADVGKAGAEHEH